MTSKALTDWKAKLAARAQDREASIPTIEATYISTRGGVLTYGDHQLPEPFPVIILDECVEYAYYEGEWDPSRIETPACFALSAPVTQTEGILGEGLKPHKLAESPQSEECATCWANVFGSGKGNGKACGNRRRLLVAAAKPAHGDLANTDVALMKIPPTGLKTWDNYVRTLSRGYGLPPEGVVTNLSMSQVSPKSLQKTPHFEMLETLPESVLETVFKLQEINRPVLERPFEKRTDPVTETSQLEKPSPRVKAATRTKAAPKKRAIRKPNAR